MAGRWRRIARWVAGLAVAGGVLVGAATVSGAWLARDVLSDAERREALLERLLDGSGVSVDYGDLQVVRKVGWTVLVDDLTVVTPTAQVTVDHAETDVPGFWSMWLGRVDLGSVRLDGLSVTVPKRPVPRKRGGMPLRVVADVVLVRDSTLRMPADGPLPEARADGVSATLTRLVFVGGKGLVGGRGTVAARRWRTGRVEVTDVVLDDVRLGRREHRLDGRLRMAGGGAEGRLTIGNLSGERPSVHAEVRVRDGDLEELVMAATGQTSPLTGKLSGEFEVDAGGDRAPGAGVTRADVVLTDGALALGGAVPPALKAVLKVAPFVEVKRGQVLLGPTEATFVMSEGVVEVERLVHQGKGRPLAARGAIRGRELDLVVRLVPKKRSERRAGVGVVMQGTAGALSVRKATDEELLGVGDPS